MKLRLEKWSYRFAEQVLNSRLMIKQEIESILTDSSIPIPELSRPNFNKLLRELFLARRWEDQPAVFGKLPYPADHVC